MGRGSFPLEARVQARTVLDQYRSIVFVFIEICVDAGLYYWATSTLADAGMIETTKSSIIT